MIAGKNRIFTGLQTIIEINTLEITGKYSGINITQLAQKRGVTKGAVSHMDQPKRKSNC